MFHYFQADKGNVYFAAFAASITLLSFMILFSRILGALELNTAWWLSGVTRAVMIASALLGMHFMHSLRGFRYRHSSRLFLGLLAAGMVIAALASQNVLYFMMLLVMVELMRALWLALRARLERIRIIGLGFSAMIVAVMIQVGVAAGWITLHTWQHYPPILAQLAITLSMSAYLGGQFASTNRRLKAKMEEARQTQQALTESEARYRTMFENALAGVGIVDDTGKLVFVNERYVEILGYRMEDVIGHDVRKRIAPEYLDEINRRFTRILAGEVLKDAHEFEVTHADGGRRTIQVCANAYRPEGGGIYTIIHVMDVTESRVADRKQREALQLAERTSRLASIGVMAGGITHEINQPLNAIMLHAETLQFLAKSGRLDQTAPVLEALDHIVMSTERISEIVRHMRSFWVAPGRPQVAPVDLNAAALHGLEMTEQKIRSHAIRLETAWSPDPLVVKADALQLEQIAINLISNAVNALDKIKRGDKRVAVRTRREGAQAVLEVEDNGIGLPPEGDRIFDPFFSTEKEQGGTGLGLAIVKMFVEKFSGTVRAGNNAEGGAIFTVRLPLEGE
jgi:PAS domain S-box-containing protein